MCAFANCGLLAFGNKCLMVGPMCVLVFGLVVGLGVGWGGGYLYRRREGWEPNEERGTTRARRCDIIIEMDDAIRWNRGLGEFDSRGAFGGGGGN